MATATFQGKSVRTVQDARAVQNVSTVTRVNRVPISQYGAIGKVPGPSGRTSPLSSITFRFTNASGGPLTYVVGDPTLMVAGAIGVTFTQPTAVKNGSVAAVQESFQSSPVSVAGLNLIASDPALFDGALLYRYADRDGRYGQEPIDIPPILRNNQYIADRQTVMFAEPYGIDEFSAFTMYIPDGESMTFVLLLDANAA